MTLVLGYLSVTTALANVVVKVDPASAIALNSYDGQIVAAYAQQQFTATPDASVNSEQTRLAGSALRMDPTAVEALTVLGLGSQLRSDDALADQAFRYSVWLSRRELQPQIWAIEKAVVRGDIDQALKNYDIALRTSVSARDMLFPVLSSAIAEPKIRSTLVPTLALNPVWAQPFVYYVATRGSEPRAAADLFQEASARGFAIGPDERALLINNLASKEFMNEAWAQYASLRHETDPSRSRDRNFMLDAKVRTPFDWKTGNTPGLSVAILQEANGGIVDFGAAPSVGAPALTQTQMLPSGVYRFWGKSRGIEQPERSRPYWSLVCSGGKELGRVEVPNSSQASGEFSGAFVVPADCSVQTLSLILRASDSISGVSGQIESAQLKLVKR